MTTTTPSTRRSVYPTLRYDHPDEAIELLVNAFGFAVTEIHKSESGDLRHAELSLDTGVVMIGQRPPGQPAPPPQTRDYVIYVAVDDVDAHHARAAAAGARVTRPPQDQPYGSREYDAVDGEGNVWCFGTHRP